MLHRQNCEITAFNNPLNQNLTIQPFFEAVYDEKQNEKQTIPASRAFRLV